VHADQLRLLVDCFGLVLHDTAGPTHQCDGTLDVVITHTTVGRPDGVDDGLSDHSMLRWQVDATRDVPPSVTVSSRRWRRLDVELLRSALSTSRLCQPESWPSDIDEMKGMYDTELNNVLDVLLPKRQFVRRPRPTDPCFDKECRDAKRVTRRLERKFAVSTRRAAVVNESVVGTSQSAAVSALKLPPPRRRGTTSDDCIASYGSRSALSTEAVG